MKEVSCRPFHVLLRPLERRGVALERVVMGTSLSVAELRGRRGRMSWTESCTILHNIRPHFSDAELVALGAELFRPRARRAPFVVARLLIGPMYFYRWLNQPRTGAGNQSFSCIRPAMRELSEHECEIELTLPAGYEVAWEFFLLTKGSLEEVPRMFGHGPASVKLERLPNGARYHVVIPPRPPVVGRIRRALQWPFVVLGAARELRAANEELVGRLEQLEQTTAELDRYKADLARIADERTDALREPPATAGPMIRPEPTDIATLVDCALDAWRAAVETAGLVLERREFERLLASVDPIAIERIVSSLLSHALRNSRRGGHIAVELAREADGIRLSVIATDAKTSNGAELTLVRELAQAHGGSASARASATGGVELRVVLPAGL